MYLGRNAYPRFEYMRKLSEYIYLLMATRYKYLGIYTPHPDA